MVETDARERVRAAFPQLEARRVAPIGSGWTVDTYDVDGEWIVQFPRSDYAADRLRSQIRVLPELAAELSAMVPTPIFTDLEIPAMVYHRLDGEPLDRGARRVVAGAARPVPVRPAPHAAGVCRAPRA